MKAQPFETIALISSGATGSLIIQEIQARRLARTVAVAVHDDGTLEHSCGLEGDGKPSAIEAITCADLVIFSVPFGVGDAIVTEIAMHLKPGAVLTDVGAIKGPAITRMLSLIPDRVHFVPGHLMVGTEHAAFGGGYLGPFGERRCILTPPHGTNLGAVAKVTLFWEALGVAVDQIDPQHHDKLLAVVSHLPHIIAHNIVRTAKDLEPVIETEVNKFAASGFCELTRLAVSDATIWRDICLHNKDAILEMLARFSEDLDSVRRAIRWEDGDGLLDLFTRTRAVRRSFTDLDHDKARLDLIHNNRTAVADFVKNR